MRKKAILLICVVFSCCMASRVYADNFVVTNTADSGPGSLREAILRAAANGTAATDQIHFNIAQTIFNRRIINLLSPLPSLSSNLIIDGTTQPGEKFAITDAKICIKKDDYVDEFVLFNIENATQVKIYGIYMIYGYWKWDIERGDRSKKLYAIKLSNAFDIEIGAPGKGNVINGYHFGIYSSSDSCRNIRIQSNYMGQGLYYTDYTFDIDEVVVSVKAGIEMLNAKDVLIGGPNSTEGNLIKADRAVSLDSRYATGNGFIHIVNNVFGKDYDRMRILGGQDPFSPNVFIGESLNYLGASPRPSMDYDVLIQQNDIPTSLGLDKLSKRFLIKGNKFDLPPGSSLFTNRPAKLSITNCADGEIGGNTNAEINTFRENGVTGIFAISADQNTGLTISKNIFECNVLQGTPTVISSNKTVVPVVRINSMTNSEVSGTATPLSTIELFYDDDCAACEGKVFIASTTADAGGNWLYMGNFTGGVVATATSSSGATGEFSVPKTDTTNVVITHPACGLNNGSIRGLTISGGNGYRWQIGRAHV